MANIVTYMVIAILVIAAHGMMVLMAHVQVAVLKNVLSSPVIMVTVSLTFGYVTAGMTAVTTPTRPEPTHNQLGSSKQGT